MLEMHTAFVCFVMLEYNVAFMQRMMSYVDLLHSLLWLNYSSKGVAQRRDEAKEAAVHSRALLLNKKAIDTKVQQKHRSIQMGVKRIGRHLQVSMALLLHDIGGC